MFVLSVLDFFLYVSPPTPPRTFYRRHSSSVNSDKNGQQALAKTKMATACRFRISKIPLRLLVSRALCTHESPKSHQGMPSFDYKEVRSILRKITGRNLDKIYSARKQGLGVPSYKLMTDAEFLEVRFDDKIRMHPDT